MSKISERLSLPLHLEVFARISKLTGDKKLLKGKNVAVVDSATLEADAAMTSIVQRDHGDDRKQVVSRVPLMVTYQDLRAFQYPSLGRGAMSRSLHKVLMHKRFYVVLYPQAKKQR